MTLRSEIEGEIKQELKRERRAKLKYHLKILVLCEKKVIQQEEVVKDIESCSDSKFIKKYTYM